MLGHPHLLLVAGGQGVGTLHVAQWRMTVEVSRYDVHLVAGRHIVEECVGIGRVKAQRFGTDEANPGVGLTVEHVGIVLDQVELLLWGVEASAVIYPPVGFVLYGHGIHLDTVRLHVLEERVEPGEELLVAVLAQGGPYLALFFALAAIGSPVGLVFPWRRPGRAEHDAATLLDHLGRGQASLPVVGRVGSISRGDIPLEVGGDFHTHDVESNL